MSSLMDVKTAAQYNKWANNRIYNCLKQLSDDERKKDRINSIIFFLTSSF